MRDLDCQLDYWNRTGPGKPFSHPVNLSRLQHMAGPHSAILDIGCGYGRTLGLLADNGYVNLHGVDPATAMIAAARQRFPQIRFDELTDPPYLPLPDASVDAALLFSVLTCVPTDEGQRAIVREASRVLRRDGLLYISDLWLQSDTRNRERYELGFRKYGTFGVFDLPEGVTLRHHDRSWIDNLTDAYDLAALDAVEITTMNGHAARGFQWFGRRL